MTSTQGLFLLVGAPVAATLIAILARARPAVLIAAAILSELAAYAVGLWWGSHLVQSAIGSGQPVLTAHLELSLAARVLRIVILCIFAALVGLVGLGLAHIFRRGAA